MDQRQGRENCAEQERPSGIAENSDVNTMAKRRKNIGKHTGSVRRAKKYVRHMGAPTTGMSAFGKIRGRSRKAKAKAKKRSNPGATTHGWVKAKAVKIVRNKRGQ